MIESNFFAEPKVLLLGAIAGFAFGVLLQKGKVTRYETIVGQFLLRDFTMLKIMLTAIIVGSIGIYGMLALGIPLTLEIKSASLYGVLLGSAIFAVGMVLLGYCPGTGVAAIADGSRDALWGVLGMLIGAALYAESDAWMKEHVLSLVDYGKVTLPQITGISPWVFIAGLAVVAVFGFSLLERWEKSRVTSQ